MISRIDRNIKTPIGEKWTSLVLFLQGEMFVDKQDTVV